MKNNEKEQLTPFELERIKELEKLKQIKVNEHELIKKI
jgi:hypothetical protein